MMAAVEVPDPPVDSEITDIPSPIPVGNNPTVLDWVKSITKSLLATALIIISSLLSILSAKGTLADVTFVQWLWIASFVLLGGHAVWKAPNKTL